MPGGLMNLTSMGNENIILNGNPKKTFFKATYNKYTNFGMQKFRIDFEGNRVLNYDSPTVLDFKIPRYADMLYDTFICINMPDIYSPIKHVETDICNNNLLPYNFKWINEVGAFMIREIEIYSGGVSLSKYTGEYLSCLKERDYSLSKRKLWDKMVGNVTEMTDPGNTRGNVNTYPHAAYMDERGVEPSIRGRKLYIPMDAFFCDSTKLAIPLVALQYQEISIRITFEPVSRLYTINNVDAVEDNTGISYRSAPNPNIPDQQLWRFIQPPADRKASVEKYNTRNDWNSDIHLISSYIFLDKEEQRVMAMSNHKILMKQIYTYTYLGKSGSQIVDIESKDLVSNYTWRFRRSDAFERNEWNNYTNWAYKDVIPQKLQEFQGKGGEENGYTNKTGAVFFSTGPLLDTFSSYSVNVKEILIDLAIVIEGIYRENVFDSGVYNYLEKYNKTGCDTKDGLYFYSFATNGLRNNYQPTGAMNMNKFKNVSFEYNTISTPLSITGNNTEYICDLCGNAIGFRKNTSSLYDYTFDLVVFEERYNVIMIQGGRIGLLHAR